MRIKLKLYSPLLSLVPALSFSALSLAEDGAESKSIAADAEIGVIITTGNTESSSYKGKIDIRQDLENWKNQYIFEGFYKQDVVTSTREVPVNDGSNTTTIETFEEDQTTENKYFLSLQSDYKLSDEDAAFFVYGEYEKNRFSGFDYQSTIALGYSDRLFKTDNSSLTYDIGPGWKTDRLEDVGDVEGETENTFIIRAAAEYMYQFSENAKFTQTISSNYSTDANKNTKTKAVSALTTQINSTFALKVSYTVDHNSEVSGDRKKADTATAITLVYSY